MEALIAYLSTEGGLIGLLFAASIGVNVVFYRQIQAMHKDARDNDRATLQQLFEALALIREIGERLRRG